MTTAKADPVRRAVSIFKDSGGLMRMSAAVQAGVHRATLKKMLEQGKLHKASRGLYQLAGVRPTQPDLAIVAARAPQAVVCLISALSFHELTTQIPHEVHLAIGRNWEPPRIDYPPVRIYRFSGQAFTEGIDIHSLGPVRVRVYSVEKTIADCFKYRNKIGLDVCVEALRAYRRRRSFHPDTLMKFASICRVANVMRPFIESVL